MFFEKFKSVYKNKISENSLQHIKETSEKILSLAKNNDNNYQDKKTGIMVGKIQSGKTASFIGLMSQSFDSDIDIIFVIGGNNEDLLKQNEKRINEVFISETIEEQTKFSVDIFNIATIDVKKEKFLRALNNNKKIIITILKSNFSLEKTLHLIEDNNELFNQKNVLILDDEGDQGTLNGKVNSKTENKESKWYLLIKNIKNQLANNFYLTITATPYANFFIKLDDIFSPDFLVTIDYGENYCGLNSFHNSDRKNIIIIPETEKELFKDDNEESFLDNESLRMALCCFMFGALEKNKINSTAKSEMLIHIDRKIKSHGVTLTKMEEIISYLIEISELDENDLIYKKAFINNFIKPSYEIFYNKEFLLKENEEIVSKIIKMLPFFTIKVLNRPSLDIHENETRNPLTIYIGANLIERGVTFEDLITVYMPRETKTTNMDTLLQRARWFGYRKPYLNCIRIFLTEKVAGIFETIMQSDNDLWTNMNYFEKNQFISNSEDMKEWLKYLKIELGYHDQQLRPTRKNVTDILGFSKKKSFFKQTNWKDLDEKNHQNEISWYSKNLPNTKIKRYGQIEHSEIEFKNWSEFNQNISDIKYSIFF